MTTTPIIALDVPTAAAAMQLVRQLDGLCGFYKIGSELFTQEGPEVVRAVRSTGAAVFLDLKFHDIPNTVRGAVRSAAALGVQLLTVHAAAGSAALEAAATAAREAGGECDILAVTVLTSMDAAALGRSWGRDEPDVEREVLRLSRTAADAGVAGVVCSGREAAAVRAQYGGRLDILVPGVRFPGSASQDQARVVSPHEAAQAGARYIVVGRAVTTADHPADAMRTLLADLP